VAQVLTRYCSNPVHPAWAFEKVVFKQQSRFPIFYPTFSNAHIFPSRSLKTAQPGYGFSKNPIRFLCTDSLLQ
jgi:hypothetical protein